MRVGELVGLMVENRGVLWVGRMALKLVVVRVYKRDDEKAESWVIGVVAELGSYTVVLMVDLLAA